METFDTPNSTQTFSSPESYGVRMHGAGGGDAASDEDATSGGRGGYIEITVPAETAIDILIAEGGSQVSGGKSPHYNGGDGGDASPSVAYAKAGGGAASTAIVRQSDGVVLAVVDGGGGGAATDNDGAAQSGGGGGGRGGQGGHADDAPGSNGAGTGQGGNGGRAEINGSFNTPGDPGGQTAHSDVVVYNQNTGGGNDGDAVVEIVETKPTAVPSASQVVQGDDSIDVSWDSVAGADSYEVQVSEDGGSWAPVDSTGGTSITYSASPATNTHQFRVRGVSLAGGGDWTSTSTTTTDPTDLMASTAGTGSIDLSWTGVPDASEYRVLRATSSGSTSGDYTEVATPGGTTYTDTDVSQGTQYYYRIQAVYPETNSQLTDEATATIGLSSPVIETLNVGGRDEIAVEWQLTDTASDGSVEIYRSTDGSLGTQLTSISDLSTTSYTDTGLDDGTAYQYTVRRVAGPIADSDPASATTGLPAPTELQGAGVGATTIDIEWTAIHNTGETRIEYKPTNESEWLVSKEVGRTTEAATVDGLRNGEQYDIRVVAVTPDDEQPDQSGPATFAVSITDLRRVTP